MSSDDGVVNPAMQKQQIADAVYAWVDAVISDPLDQDKKHGLVQSIGYARCNMQASHYIKLRDWLCCVKFNWAVRDAESGVTLNLRAAVEELRNE